MKSNYKKLGSYIREINIRNQDLEDLPLLGVSVSKNFIPSIANTVGTDFSKYKKVSKNQFTYIPDTSRRGDKIGIAILLDYEKALVSQAYTVFEVIDTDLLSPEYLMLWFKRPEFDRYARFKSEGSVREIFSWNEMCNVELPIPDIEIQRKIVNQYNQINNAIQIKEAINNNLEQQAQAIFKSWFVDFCRSEAECCLGDFFEILKGKNITKDTAALGDIPVVAGGLTPAYYHNKFNAIAPVVTISASGVNAGYVNLYTTNIWASDCSYFDFKNGNQVYFIYCLLKERQTDIYWMQTGSAQPHIYPKNIMELPIPNVDYQVVDKFGELVALFFNIIKINQERCNVLQQLRDTLLPKLMLENSDSCSDKLSFSK